MHDHERTTHCPICRQTALEAVCFAGALTLIFVLLALTGVL